MRVSFTVRVSVRVIQVAILSCNCEATQPRRFFFISSYFRSVWHPFSCFILRMIFFFICVTSLGPTHFPSCSSHTVNTFFYCKFLHPEYGSQCCKYTLTEPPESKIHVHTPVHPSGISEKDENRSKSTKVTKVTAHAFWGHHIED